MTLVQRITEVIAAIGADVKTLAAKTTVYNSQTGSYTLVASDLAKIVRVTSAQASTITIPTGLGAGFNCAVRQSGAGQITIAAASGITLNGADSQFKTAKQYATITIDTHDGVNFIVSGYTAA